MNDRRKNGDDAYFEIVTSGALKGKQLKALEGVIQIGPCTGRELSSWAQRRGAPADLWKRLSELERMGVVAATATKTCGITGSRAASWVATGRAPTGNGRPAKAGNDDAVARLESTVQDLRDEIEKLESKIATLEKSQRQLDFFSPGDAGMAAGSPVDACVLVRIGDLLDAMGVEKHGRREFVEWVLDGPISDPMTALEAADVIEWLEERVAVER